MILDAFPTPIYIDNLSLSVEDREKLKSADLFRNRDDKAWVSNTNLQLNSSYRNFIDLVDQHVNNYAYNILSLSNEYAFKCHGCWLNKNDPSDETLIHHHSNSLISGVYYVDVDADTQGAIEFYDSKQGPFGSFFTLLSYSQKNIRNSHILTLNCSNDMIIMFPSILKHSVAKNTSTKSRYSVAFDYMVSGTVDAMVNRMTYDV